ncbi:MAG: hypothetical protein ACI9W2_002286 [Gammaproteobacteria bacterium]
MIVEKSGISATLLLNFVNHADLCGVKGVGGEYSELLEAAGVDTVPDLGQRHAEKLTAKMLEVNEEKTLVRSPSSAKKVTDCALRRCRLVRARRLGHGTLARRCTRGCGACNGIYCRDRASSAIDRVGFTFPGVFHIVDVQ